MTNVLRVAVIGSGVAGLSAAVRLAKKGHRVDVYEKNAYPGGKLSHFKLGEYSFDAGPSLFTHPDYIEDLFSYCDVPMDDFFSYNRSDIACQYFFSSGAQVTAWADTQKFAKELATKIGEDAQRITAYLQQAKKAYTHIGDLFLTHSLHDWGTFFQKKVFAAIFHSRPDYLTSSMNDFNNKWFSKPETVQLFNRYATYNGSNPYTAPAMLTMIPHLEFNQGTFYPKGGMISITNALVGLAERMGVTFHYSTEVTGIDVKDHQVTSVRAGGEIVPCNAVVSNMDAYYTYKYLLNDEKKAAGVLRQERSSSAIIFYWGINREFSQLHLHNIFFSNDYASEFDHIFRKKTLHPDPTVYINITSKMEANQAAKGGENWFVMINAPHDTGQNWDEFRKEARLSVLRKLSSTLGVNIEQHIMEEDYLDPPRIDVRTASHTGSLYGTSSNSRFAAFLRHPNFSRQRKGLYFAGGSVHPGGGIPLCIQSGKIAAERIEKDRL